MSHAMSCQSLDERPCDCGAGEVEDLRARVAELEAALRDLFAIDPTLDFDTELTRLRGRAVDSVSVATAEETKGFTVGEVETYEVPGPRPGFVTVTAIGMPPAKDFTYQKAYTQEEIDRLETSPELAQKLGLRTSEAKHQKLCPMTNGHDWCACHLSHSDQDIQDVPRTNEAQSLHMNPDASVWAAEFKKTCDKLGKECDEGWMLGWFANAMMAMHDHLKSKEQRPETACTHGRTIDTPHYSYDWCQDCGAIRGYTQTAGEWVTPKRSTER